MPPAKPLTGSILDGAVVAKGTTASVTSIQVQGYSRPLAPGTGPVTVTDPLTSTVTGTLDVLPDGTFTFTPAPGYTGPVPGMSVAVAGSDGQSVTVPVNLMVNAVLRDDNEAPSVTAGSGPARLNVLSNAVAPPGTTVNVTSFSLPGSTAAYPAGPSPVQVVDPLSGQTAGSMVLQPDGSFTFTPAPGFRGAVPAVTYSVACSDGQVSPGAVAVKVIPGMHGRMAACPHACTTWRHACTAPACQAGWRQRRAGVHVSWLGAGNSLDGSDLAWSFCKCAAHEEGAVKLHSQLHVLFALGDALQWVLRPTQSTRTALMRLLPLWARRCPAASLATHTCRPPQLPP